MDKTTPVIEELVTDEQLNNALGNANFGSSISKRDIIKYTLLKCASGYRSGNTAKCIVYELGLTTKSWTLSKKGKEYLYFAFYNGTSI